VQLLDDIVQEEFTAVTATFDHRMKEALSAQRLCSAWGDYRKEFGAYGSHGDPEQLQRGDLTVVNIALRMEKQPGQFRVTFHPDGTVAGLYFLRSGVPVP
jgi:hypothetical protein